MVCDIIAFVEKNDYTDRACRVVFRHKDWRTSSPAPLLEFELLLPGRLMVGHLTLNQAVGGSSPPPATKKEANKVNKARKVKKVQKRERKTG